MALATIVGRPIWVYATTRDIRRGKFMKVCMETDLNKLVTDVFCFVTIGIELNMKACIEYAHHVAAMATCQGSFQQNQFQQRWRNNNRRAKR